MGIRLTDSVIKGLPAPMRGNRIYYDDTVKGFGCRITAAGARAFILNYRTTSGRERRYTLGAFPDWRTTAAREAAKRLKLEIRANGTDPVAVAQGERDAPTVADLCERYIREHLPKKRPASAADDCYMIKRSILPALGSMKVTDVTFSDVDRLHQVVTKSGTPIRANRVVSLLSKMFALSIRWRWRTDNPVKGVAKNPETKRKRYLKPDEIARLNATLATWPDQVVANMIRLLMVSGARRNEVTCARWDQFDLDDGKWVKPGSMTKQKTEHEAPLSPQALALLLSLHADADSEFVFPGTAQGHKTRLRRAWPKLCKAAGITGLRLHDIRHSFAAVLASSGVSLHVIGTLLGHSQAATTSRYAHIYDEPLRKAAATAGAIIAGKPVADVVELKGGRR